MRHFLLLAAALAACAPPQPVGDTPPIASAPAVAQEPIDSAINARIRDEGMQRSRVLSTALMLSDLNGPRLAGSAGYTRAALLVRDQMQSWGLTAALEPWGRRGRGWEIERYSVELLAPHYLRVNAVPKAWSPPLARAVTGRPVLVSIRSEADFAAWRGKLRGMIVLNGFPAFAGNRFAPMAHRLTDAELDSLARLTDPGEPVSYWEDINGWTAGLAAREKVNSFFRDEGAVAILEPSRQYDVLNAATHVSYVTERSGAVPAFIVGREHYDRIARLVLQEAPVRLELSLQTRFTTPDSLGYNVIAELPGTDPQLGAEVVLVGGHLDSWHAGTGATDNASGSAIAMEALRILKAIGAQPRRTIRMGLWDGEEQEDYLGSGGYVRRHYGDPATMRLLPEHSRFSAYFNIDHGTGRIRGAFLQGNAAARPILAQILEPFRDLGARTLSIQNYGGTDHVPFWGVGLPAFNIMQDPIDYSRRTHHTDMDVGSLLLDDDLKQASVVLASILYHVSIRDEKMPRMPLPQPRQPVPAAATGNR